MTLVRPIFFFTLKFEQNIFIGYQDGPKAISRWWPRLWRTLHGALGEASNVDAGELTAEEFAVFFKNKVESVRASTRQSTA